MDFHLRDDKLHVVAAPGAGKTTLGIEVISRLNRPSLILCPTNTIKNQWKERIRTSFLQEKDYGIVSTDIRKPGYITVITYQALLAAFCGFDEEPEGWPRFAGLTRNLKTIARKMMNGRKKNTPSPLPVGSGWTRPKISSAFSNRPKYLSFVLTRRTICEKSGGKR